MKLLSIYLKRLRNSEFIQFLSDLISLIQIQNPEELGIKEQLDPIVEDMESIKKLHGANKGSDISDELKLIDNSRDDCIDGISTVLEGYKLHYDNTIREAATVLLNKIESFGSRIAKQNYPTETTSIQGIVDAFTKEEKLRSALKLVNLEAWKNQMDSDNKFFNKRYLDRVDEKSKQTADNINKLRKSVTEKYFILKEHLTSHAILKQTDNYKTLIGQLNTLIEKYNVIVKSHSKGNNSSTKGDNTEKKE